MSARRPARADRFCAPAPARPPRGGQNPAVPVYFSHRSGPARRGSPPAPPCAACAAGRGKTPIFRAVLPIRRPPPRGAHLHKTITKKWETFAECSLQFLPIFIILFYNKSSTQPRSGARTRAGRRRRAHVFRTDRSLCLQVPVSHPRFSVCRERAPSPARPAPGGRIGCFVCTSLARGAAAPTGPARRAASYRKGGMPMIVRKEKCSCKS